MSRRSDARRSGFSFTELLIVILIMVIVIGFLIVCIQKLGGEDSRTMGVDGRTTTGSNLKQLILACRLLVKPRDALNPQLMKIIWCTPSGS